MKTFKQLYPGCAEYVAGRPTRQFMQYCADFTASIPSKSRGQANDTAAALHSKACCCSRCIPESAVRRLVRKLLGR